MPKYKVQVVASQMLEVNVSAPNPDRAKLMVEANWEIVFRHSARPIGGNLSFLDFDKTKVVPLGEDEG